MQTYTFNVANGTKTYTIEAANFTEAKKILRERMIADGLK